MSSQTHQGLGWLRAIYILGSIVSVPTLLHDATCSHSYDQSGYMGFALLFLLWGGLIFAGSLIAVKKGREFVEGMVLGAFGPIGFIIEVLLPPGTNPLPPPKPADVLVDLAKSKEVSQFCSGCMIVSIVFLVGVVCVSIVTSLGTTVSGTFSKVDTQISDTSNGNSTASIEPDRAAREQVETANRMMNFGRYDEVLCNANAEISAHPDRPVPYLIRASVHYYYHDFTSAESDLSKALSLHHNLEGSRFWDEMLAWSYKTKADCFRAQDLPDRAWTDINKAIAHRPDYAEAINLRGILREFSFQDNAGALQDYESARRLFPQEACYQANCLRISSKLGK